MGLPAAGNVIILPFPFSDLSQHKVRPAVCLADAGRDDRIFCQITSNPYGDSSAVLIDDTDLQSGSFRAASYARPAKLFTADVTLVKGVIGNLTEDALRRLIDRVIAVFRP